MNQNISKHFNRYEFECQCGCGFNVVDVELVKVLEKVREHFDEPIVITSGCRCSAHNAKVGGAPHSKHKNGVAVDFKVQNCNQDEVADYLLTNYSDRYGIGRYIGRTHLDVRVGKARWDKR
jgi:uncharacterized protein YcbK (DUF882 family)